MRTTRIMKALLGLFVAGMAVATVFVAALRVQAAFAAPERATVTLRYHKASIRGQWRDRQELKRAVRVLRAENRRLRVRYTRDLGYGIRLAHDLYGVPEGQMWNVTNCENPNRHPYAVNRSSGASGWFQFLGSTWRNQGLPRFSPFDPVASSLATARIVVRDGSWRQWACSP